MCLLDEAPIAKKEQNKLQIYPTYYINDINGQWKKLPWKLTLKFLGYNVIF